MQLVANVVTVSQSATTSSKSFVHNSPIVSLVRDGVMECECPVNGSQADTDAGTMLDIVG